MHPTQAADAQNAVLAKLNYASTSVEQPSLYYRSELKDIPFPRTPKDKADFLNWILRLDRNSESLNNFGKKRIECTVTMNALLSAFFNTPDLFAHYPAYHDAETVDLTVLTSLAENGTTFLDIIKSQKHSSTLLKYDHFLKEVALCAGMQALIKSPAPQILTLIPAQAIPEHTDDNAQPLFPLGLFVGMSRR